MVPTNTLLGPNRASSHTLTMGATLLTSFGTKANTPRAVPSALRPATAATTAEIATVLNTFTKP